MEINRQNYEIYLLDYIEGNLPENMVLAVLTFLKNNPDIEKEAADLIENHAIPESVRFEGKENLKKNVFIDIPGISRFEQLSVSYLEQNISDSELAELKSITHFSNKKAFEHQLLQKIKLVPDPSIFYPYKSTLKRSVISWKRVAYWFAAASVVLVAGFAIMMSDGKSNQYGSEIALNTRKITIQKQVFVPETSKINFSKENSEQSTKIINQTLNSDTIRKEEIPAILQTRQLAMIDIPFERNVIQFESYQKTVKNANSIADDGYTPLQEYLNAKIKEKVLKQHKNEKVTFVSVVNAFGRFTKKVLNKKLEVEKSTTEDGQILYAIRTDSFDLYSKKNAKNKNK